MKQDFYSHPTNSRSSEQTKTYTETKT